MNTKSSYGKMYRRIAKISLTSSEAMEEQFTHFTYITYQWKQNGSVLLVNKQCTEQLERTQNLPMAKCMGRTGNITKIIIVAMEKQSTRLK